MTLRRPEDAENESPKSASIVVRMGDDTKALLDRAAHHRGMNSGSYVRQAAVRAALSDLPPTTADPAAAADAERVADNG